MKTHQRAVAVALAALLAACGGSGSGGSGSVTVAPSTAPGDVAAVAGFRQVALSWSPVAGASSYNIYWSSSPGVTPASGTAITGVTSPYSHTGLTNGSPYYYVVTASNAGGASPASAQVSATPADVAAPAPAGVNAAIGVGTVTISWTPVYGALSYDLYWSNTAGVTPATGTSIAVGASSSYVQYVTAGLNYYYVVTALFPAGESAPSAEASALGYTACGSLGTCGLVPSTPTGVAARVVGAGQIQLTWNGESNVSTFNIYWSTTPGVSPTHGTKIAGAALVPPLSTSPYTQSGLASGTYYYVITAVNGIGESLPSAQVSATL